MRMYGLQIYIDPTSLDQIVQTGNKIVFSKQATPSDLSIAWVVFSPVETNAVEWRDLYSVYASPTSIQTQAPIIQTASAQADAQSAYGYIDSFVATTPHTPLGGGTYEIVNQSSQTLTFGMAQQITINGYTHGPNVVSAAKVLPGQFLDMTPSRTITVFLSNNAFSSMCLGSVPGSALTIQFSDGSFQSIKYNPNQGGFQMS